MKYNGMEVTDEFLQSVAGKILKSGYPRGARKVVEVVLQAAEEVFAEMQPKFEVGDRVKYGKREGRIYKISKRGKSARLWLDGDNWPTGNVKIGSIKPIEEASE